MALTKVNRNGLNTGISDSSDATSITIDSNENVGINNTNPDQYVTTGKVVAIQGTAYNSGPAGLHMNGHTDGAGYFHTQAFSLASVTSATEITRLTGSGANGFRCYFKITVCGHTGGLGDGINIKEYHYGGGTTAPTQISTFTQGSPPTISFDNSTSNVLIVKLASGNGSGGYNGAMKVEWLIPVDFAGSTWTIS